ncbi:hypothetical protein IO403_001439 [Campylobacter lari]|nr:hypothetical protein [Campylobacter lari]
MKNIVLLGGSNSVLTNGLRKGLQQPGVNLINLALGATSCIQNLYELKRKFQLIQNADLIVTESNINDSFSMNNVGNCRILKWYYEELLRINKKILVLILPFYEYNYKATNHIHRYFINKYCFNFIDLQRYYDFYQLENFSKLREENGSHQFEFILRELGKNIVTNVNNFKFSTKKICFNNPEFVICDVNELVDKKINSIKNSMYEENYFRIEEGSFIKFPEKYYNYYIIAYHTWNNINDTTIVAPWSWIERRGVKSKLIISDDNYQIEIEPCLDNIVYETNFIKINSNTKITCSTTLNSTIEFNHVDLISFFLINKNEDNDKFNEYTTLVLQKNIDLNNFYCFDSLIPPIRQYKKIIEEYCAIMDSKKNAICDSKIQNLELQLQNKTNELKNLQESITHKKQLLEVQNLEQDVNLKHLKAKEIQENINLKTLEKTKIQKELEQYSNNIVYIERYHQSAKQRIYNHLSYKLGFCAIKNSKTFLGWITMPITLLSILIAHKQEQKIYQEKIQQNPSLRLPSLESYIDYQEAKKEENSFTYKLGQAIINANKTWYKGGYVRLIFEIRKLKEEIKCKLKLSA